MKKQRAGSSQDNFEDKQIERCAIPNIDIKNYIKTMWCQQRDIPIGQLDINRAKYEQASSSHRWEEDRLQ